jgi:hypothetical protein
MQNHESANISTEKYIKTNYPELYSSIMGYTTWMEESTTFTTRVFYWYNNLTEYILCEKCEKPIDNIAQFWKYKKNTFATLTNTCMLCNNCKRQGSRPIDSKIYAFSTAKEKSSDKYYDDDYINKWAIEFKTTNNRKPTKDDFKQFLNRSFPRKSLCRKFDTKLFALYEPYLEAVVCSYINSLGYMEQYVTENCHEFSDYVRNKMIRDPSTNKRLQLDIYFPLLNFAIEVQDFQTHSKTSDEEISSGKFKDSFKHGPTYHEHKRKVAADQNIILIDLWEDDITSGKYKKELDTWIKTFI